MPTHLKRPNNRCIVINSFSHYTFPQSFPIKVVLGHWQSVRTPTKVSELFEVRMSRFTGAHPATKMMVVVMMMTTSAAAATPKD